VGWVTGSGLVEIAEFYFDLLIAASDGAEVSHVRVAADPNRRTLRHASPLRSRKPLVEALRATSNVGVRVARHLEIAARMELGDTFFVVHGQRITRAKRQPTFGRPVGRLRPTLYAPPRVPAERLRSWRPPPQRSPDGEQSLPSARGASRALPRSERAPLQCPPRPATAW
jgi:hypothetical protein